MPGFEMGWNRILPRERGTHKKMQATQQFSVAFSLFKIAFHNLNYEMLSETGDPAEPASLASCRYFF